MTRLTLAVSAAFVATPALAHDGPHLHPHGLEAGWAILAAGLALAALGGIALWRR